MLDHFIYENEPAGLMDSATWRRDLQKALVCVQAGECIGEESEEKAEGQFELSFDHAVGNVN